MREVKAVYRKSNFLFNKKSWSKYI